MEEWKQDGEQETAVGGPVQDQVGVALCSGVLVGWVKGFVVNAGVGHLDTAGKQRCGRGGEEGGGCTLGGSVLLFVAFCITWLSSHCFARIHL